MISEGRSGRWTDALIRKSSVSGQAAAPGAA
jgi:hypothetical protein